MLPDSLSTVRCASAWASLFTVILVDALEKSIF
jgi:hypothetical protein